MGFVVYETATGRPITLARDLPRGGLPAAGAGETVVGVDPFPDLGGAMWDPASRAFVARPAKVLVDRIDDLRSDVEYQPLRDAVAALRPQDRATMQSAIEEAFINMLGPERFRNAREAPRISRTRPDA